MYSTPSVIGIRSTMEQKTVVYVTEWFVMMLCIGKSTPNAVNVRECLYVCSWSEPVLLPPSPMPLSHLPWKTYTNNQIRGGFSRIHCTMYYIHYIHWDFCSLSSCHQLISVNNYMRNQRMNVAHDHNFVYLLFKEGELFLSLRSSKPFCHCCFLFPHPTVGNK